MFICIYMYMYILYIIYQSNKPKRFIHIYTYIHIYTLQNIAMKRLRLLDVAFT